MKGFKRVFIYGVVAAAGVCSVLGGSSMAYATEGDSSTTSGGGESSVSTQTTTETTDGGSTGPGVASADSTEITDTLSTAPTTEQGQPTEKTDTGTSTTTTVVTSPGTSSPTTPTDPATDPGNETAEVWWELPNGGTPDKVTWPQPLLPGASVGCGKWAQVDTYHVRDIPGLTADLKLDLGEDYNGIAISWRFVYGGDCEVVVTPPTPTCENGGLSCPVDTLTSTPAPTPPGSDSPANSTEVTNSDTETSHISGTPTTARNTATSPHTERLAATGNNYNYLPHKLAFGGLLLTCGGVLVWFGVKRRRNNG